MKNGNIEDKGQARLILTYKSTKDRQTRVQIKYRSKKRALKLGTDLRSF